MKILAIFAHPDDESMGPGGNLAKWIKEGHMIHLICVTCGQSSEFLKKDDLECRIQELDNASKALGIISHECLDFTDGQIGNIEMIRLQKILIEKINHFKPDILLTFNLNGVSGHLDHIAVASATTYAFNHTTHPQKLYYFTLSKQHANLEKKDYFVFMPDGITDDEAHETIDITDTFEQKLNAIRTHLSQTNDGDKLIKEFANQPQKEYFIVKTREQS